MSSEEPPAKRFRVRPRPTPQLVPGFYNDCLTIVITFLTAIDLLRLKESSCSLALHVRELLSVQERPEEWTLLGRGRTFWRRYAIPVLHDIELDAISLQPGGTTVSDLRLSVDVDNLLSPYMWPYPGLYVMSEEGAYGSLLELGVSLLRSTISLVPLIDCEPDCACWTCGWISEGRNLIDWTTREDAQGWATVSTPSEETSAPSPVACRPCLASFGGGSDSTCATPATTSVCTGVRSSDGVACLIF